MSSAMQILAELHARGISPTGLCADSRQVRAGDVFVALPGLRSDGRQFIAAALERGALAVLLEAEAGSDQHQLNMGVPILLIEHLAAQLGDLADLIYAQPSAQLTLFGVTGTNGKTTVSQCLAQAYHLLGKRCGVIGTLGSGFLGELQESPNTTPDVASLHATLAGLRDAGAEACAMEVSSIGLDQQRVQAIAFDVAIFTNLSRDHLEYHGDMQRYAVAKAKLFAMSGLRALVLNLDDAFGRELALQSANTGVRRFGYTLGASEQYAHLVESLICLESLQLGGQGLDLHIRCPMGEAQITSALLGRFNAENLLAVLAALLAVDIPFSEIVAVLPQLRAPAGRLQLVPKVTEAGAEPLVVVDYAHTPDALRQVLATLREVANARAGRLCCVFGCGGDRDAGKRPLMGQVVMELADDVWVSSDNPRSESPQQIIAEIVSGVAEHAVHIEVDRALAIRQALQAAADQDVVLLAGKGHEPYQEIAGQRLPFSDWEQAQLALRARTSIQREGVVR